MAEAADNTARHAPSGRVGAGKKLSRFVHELRRPGAAGPAFAAQKPDAGGWVLVRGAAERWYAPRAERCLLHAYWRSDTMAAWVQQKRAFVVEVWWRGQLVRQHEGRLNTAEVLIAQWHAPDRPLRWSRPLRCLRCHYRLTRAEQVRKWPCGHAFHLTCWLNPWVSRSDACPLCALQEQNGRAQ